MAWVDAWLNFRWHGGPTIEVDWVTNLGVGQKDKDGFFDVKQL